MFRASRRIIVLFAIFGGISLGYVTFTNLIPQDIHSYIPRLTLAESENSSSIYSNQSATGNRSEALHELNSADSSTDWSIIGRNFSGNPAATVDKDGKVYVFVRGEDDRLYYKHKMQSANNTETWSKWNILDIVFRGDPAATVDKDGKVYVFVRGEDDRLYYKQRTQSVNNTDTWSTQQNLGGVIAGDPAATLDKDGKVYVFVRGENDSLYYKYRMQSANNTEMWSPKYIKLGPQKFSTNPAVLTTSDQEERIYIFIKGDQNNGLYFNYGMGAANNTDTWHSWKRIDRGFGGDPAATVDKDGKVFVFTRGQDGRLYYNYRMGAANNTDTWSNRQNLGGVIAGDPAATVDKDGKVYVFVRGGNDALYYRITTNTTKNTDIHK